MQIPIAYLLRPLDENPLVLLDERGDGDTDLVAQRVALLHGDVHREAVVEPRALRPRANLVELDARELLPVAAVLREERLEHKSGKKCAMDVERLRN